MTNLNTHQGTSSWRQNLSTYAPILWIYGITLAIACILTARFNLGLTFGMTVWMAGVLSLFALLKLFDTKAFAADFAKYDLIAKISPTYAKAYPYLELGLGLFLLTGVAPILANLAILLVFSVGLLGVARALAKGEDLQCACVGRSLNLPLSKVALYENAFMVLMAGYMLLSMVG